MERKPIASGTFYPGSKNSLDRLIPELKSKKHYSPQPVSAVILPHAGYVYSGAVAANTVARIRPAKNIILLGPNHTGLGKNFALSPAEKWHTPYGPVPVNKELAKRILDSGSHIEEDCLAHRNEHSLEVELPLLQYFFADFQIVPICCAATGKENYQAVAEQIKEGVSSFPREDILFLASTDLTHYEPEETARQKDRQAIEAIVELNPEKLIVKSKKENISICGIAPVAITLFCLKDRLKKAEVVLYQTSGETSGNRESVVGYAGIILK